MSAGRRRGRRLPPNGKGWTIGGWAARVAVVLALAGAGVGCAAEGRVPVIRAAEAGAGPARHVALKKTPKHYAQSVDGACWLACARMVYDYHGRAVSEEQLNKWVTEVTANDRGADLHASRRECLIALAPDVQGGAVEALRRQLRDGSVSAQVNGMALARNLLDGAKPLRGRDLVRAIEGQEPVVIVCRNGPWTTAEHAMVVFGVTYVEEGAGGDGDVRVVSVDVLDPAVTSGVPEQKPGEELEQNIRGMYTSKAAGEMLRREMEAVQVGSYGQQQQATQNGGSGAGKSVQVGGGVGGSGGGGGKSTRRVLQFP